MAAKQSALLQRNEAYKQNVYVHLYVSDNSELSLSALQDFLSNRKPTEKRFSENDQAAPLGYEWSFQLKIQQPKEAGNCFH